MKHIPPAALVLALALGGCQNYLGDSQTRTIGEVADDVTIHTLVKTRLMRDPDVRGLRIDVSVNQGVVELSGNIRSQVERRRALQIATEVPNVDQVVDRLLVVP